MVTAWTQRTRRSFPRTCGVSRGFHHPSVIFKISVPTKKTTAFVSYSRQDGAQFAADVTNRLAKEGFSLWRDLSQMEGGRDWWDQIVEALQNVDYLLLVLTSRALASK